MKQRKVNMVFGLNASSKPVHISEVENGLACGCTCPGCGSDLIAKKGPIQEHHFAHASGSDCAAGVESGLHLAAKDILAEREEIFLPAAVVKFQGGKKPIEVFPSGLYKLSNIRLEKGIGSIVPDLLLDIDGKPMAIEIFVTHRVDALKIKKLEKLGLSTIEIDLSDIARDLDRGFIEEVVVDGYERKTWLYNPDVEARFEEARSAAKQFEIEPRGCALHVDYCPISAREYYGKPYANVIDDCTGCPYCLEIGSFVLCDANKEDNRNSNRNTLLWTGYSLTAVDFILEGEFAGKFEIGSVSRGRNGAYQFSGYNYKYKTRLTYSTDQVNEVMDWDTAEVVDVYEWLSKVTRGRVSNRHSGG
jgi:hypothetical protein